MSFQMNFPPLTNIGFGSGYVAPWYHGGMPADNGSNIITLRAARPQEPSAPTSTSTQSSATQQSTSGTANAQQNAAPSDNPLRDDDGNVDFDFD